MRVFLRGKDPTWWGDWWQMGADGERVRYRESLGLKPPEHGRSDALARLQERALEQQQHVASAPRGPRVEEILQTWLRHKRILHQSKPRSVEAFEVAVKRFSYEWGTLRASEITLDRIDEFKEMRLRSVGASTLNGDLDKLRNMLRFAVKRGMIESAPTVERIRARKRDVPKLVDKGNVRSLLAFCSESSTEHRGRFQRLEPIVRVALAAGLRIEEVRWLAWSDIDFGRGSLTVSAKPGWSPKSSHERQVPLHDAFVSYIKLWRARLTATLGRPLLPGDWYAPFLPMQQGKGSGQGEPGQQWVRGTLIQEVRMLFVAAGMPSTGVHRLHKLRGTFATRVLDGGGSLEALRQLLGHADIRTTAVYLEATDQAKRKAVLAAGWDE